MYIEITSRAYEIVEEAIEDIGYCCDTEEDYFEWEDIAASSITAFIEELDGDMLEEVCAAFREYIVDKSEEDLNMAKGIQTALVRALDEHIEYIRDNAVSYYDEDDEENEEQEADTETEEYIASAKRALSAVNKLNID